VLAVDDNVTNRRILRHQLDTWKMQVQTAADGEEALGVLKAAAEAGRRTTALLDVQMPEMDGNSTKRRSLPTKKMSRNFVVRLAMLSCKVPPAFCV
jgi:CheY-like chemotaxis protein